MEKMVVNHLLSLNLFSMLFIKVFILNTLLTHGIGENRASPAIKYLPNENCKLRETLIRVDKIDNKYFPMVVKLHRCDGSCQTYHPSVRRCIALTKQDIAVKGRRIFDRQRHNIYLQNHTSCGCPCTNDKTSCNPETQIWDERFCRCKCSPGASLRHFECRKPFKWVARECDCKCDLQCNALQTLDEKQCTCNCKPNTYQKCQALNKYFNPHTCQCLTVRERSIGESKCDGLSNKWTAVLILMGFLVFVALSFDCILYGKKTGIAFKLITFCCKRKKKNTEEANNCIPLHKGDQVEA